MLFFSCKSAVSPNNKSNIPQYDIEPIPFDGSSLRLIDANNGDLYPGDIVMAEILIKNSSESPANNIKASLDLDSYLSITGGSSELLIEKLGAGESISKTIELKVLENGIGQDTPVSVGLSLESDDSEKELNLEEDIIVFGVGPYKRKNIPIIGLHDIQDDIEIPIELYTYHFEVLCRTLNDFGYKTITFKDLLDHIDYGRVLPEKSAIITSDDGFAGLYDNAFPILKKYGQKISIFLVTNYVGENEQERSTNSFDSDRPVPMRPMLIWPEIIEMNKYGFEFLSHSHNHIRLGLADDDDFLYELITSKEEIESRLKSEVLFFAWPYDNYSEDKIPLIDEAGYRGAVRYWGGIENTDTIDLENIRRMEFNSYIPPSDYPGYLELLDLDFESSFSSRNLKAGEKFMLKYTITNNDDLDLEISSFELELENLELLEVGPEGYISQNPGKVEDVFMWVSDDYKLAAGDQIDLNLGLSGNESGAANIKFRLTSYNSYFRAEDIEISIE